MAIVTPLATPKPYYFARDVFTDEVTIGLPICVDKFGGKEFIAVKYLPADHSFSSDEALREYKLFVLQSLVKQLSTQMAELAMKEPA